MPQITVTEQIAAPASAVWSLVADFADVSWIPNIGDVVVDGEGVGMSRSIYGSGDQPVVETMTSLNTERMELGYSIADNPLPVSRFDAVVSVRPDGGHSNVTWHVDYDPAGSTPADATAARDAIEGVYTMMAGWLSDAVATRGAT